MSKFVNTVDIVGDEALTNSIIDRSITEIADEYVSIIKSYVFHSCSALTEAIFTAVTNIAECAFSYCSALTKVDLPMVTRMGRIAFSDCTALTAVILRGETMCVLEMNNVFIRSSIKSGTGYIYVPRALLSDDDATKDYRRATNWSTYAAQFRALEDYTVDGTTTGELDSTKI